jgi:3-oxoacyl-[acyl-carrier-protein] synthase II
MPKKSPRVVVTGIGAISAAGNTWESTWDSIINHRIPAGQVKRFDASTFPTRISYEVDTTDLEAKSPRPKGSSPMSWYAYSACDQALRNARMDAATLQRGLGGVVLGCGMGSPDFKWFSEVYCREVHDADRYQELNENFPHTITENIQTRYNLRGPSLTVHTACASSGQSIGEAFEILKSGDADFIITGGADSMINPFHMAGFCLLGALSKRNEDPSTASRPFDAERDGFVLGEGSCILVLETLEHAQARGANILAELCGYGCTESAYRITDLHPEGTGPIEAMQMAIDDAELKPTEVGYINAHGTSTLLNDRIEALAVSKVFGVGEKAPQVSSTKSITGHMISAAGAIELAVCIESLTQQSIPPSTNLNELDPTCEINACSSEPLNKTINAALSNSVGFGGSNTALVVKRFEQ